MRSLVLFVLCLLAPWGASGASADPRAARLAALDVTQLEGRMTELVAGLRAEGYALADFPLKAGWRLSQAQQRPCLLSAKWSISIMSDGKTLHVLHNEIVLYKEKELRLVRALFEAGGECRFLRLWITSDILL